ncbi:hypothetical protein [Candidatus Venteria ishoeyi]|uniref:Glycerophosphoryl diester phosphodiesterase membrane domain-containing protein n=1 Tax=Candidatus Venteria ishoeyi TaxID=1899563 RepID=A0A1H6F8K6_9GAMM|nr:hypothetical protein [Candidatus Venteria ishoeyi]SEH05923.1 Uncharacterised protein [Candidatus Venteria ishoeyi]
MKPLWTTPQQAQDTGELLDSAFRLFKHSLPSVLPFSFAIALFNQLLSLFLPDAQVTDETQMQAALETLSILLWPFMLGMIFLTNAMLYQIGAVLYQRQLSRGQILRFALQKLLPVFAAAVIYAVIIFFGLMAFILPGIILSVSLFFYQQEILFENRTILNALLVSHQRSWRYWWRVSIMLGVALMLMLAVNLIPLTIVGSLFYTASGPATGFHTAVTLTSIVCSSLATPYFYAVVMVTWHDLKLRTEPPPAKPSEENQDSKSTTSDSDDFLA